jgi:pilus assembly protein CpaB
VVVADLEIPPGSTLTSRMCRIAEWPADIVPAKCVSNPKTVEGRVALTSIAKGEPILLSKLAPEGTAAGLGGLLDENKLAITVKTDEVSGVAGFINPGDRVDVLVEMSDPDRSNEHFSKIILQNLKVLSKGQIWDQTTDKNHPQVVPTVTLEVTPDQAEALNLASFQGRVRLALRNQLNKGSFATRGVITSQLASRRGAPAPVAKAKNSVPQAPQREMRTVRVIKGMDVSTAEF